jgi:sugar (pentulose or hexulose) kinase
MNLMNVLTCKWDEKLLDICGGSTLRKKLGPEPVAGGLVLGKVHSYWVKKWGFNPGMYQVSMIEAFGLTPCYRMYCRSLHRR